MDKPFSNNRIEYVVKLLSISKADKILNVGISNIPEIEMKVENKTKECWTIDLDKDKINKAGNFLGKTKLIAGDFFRYNFDKKYFDKIVILEVLEHLKDDDKAVKKANSLLKIGGEIIISVPNNHALHFFNPVKYTQHERHYSNKTIRNLLEKNGFKLVHFNIVESWRLLANLYLHLFFKYILRRNVKFGFFTKKGDRSYLHLNESGLDIIIKAVKIKDL